MVKDVESTVVMPSPALVVPADWTLTQNPSHRDKQLRLRKFDQCPYWGQQIMWFKVRNSMPFFRALWFT